LVSLFNLLSYLFTVWDRPRTGAAPSYQRDGFRSDAGDNWFDASGVYRLLDL